MESVLKDVREIDLPCYLNQRVCAIRTFRTIALQWYIYYFIQSSTYINQIKYYTSATSATNLSTISIAKCQSHYLLRTNSIKS